MIIIYLFISWTFLELSVYYYYYDGTGYCTPSFGCRQPSLSGPSWNGYTYRKKYRK